MTWHIVTGFGNQYNIMFHYSSIMQNTYVYYTIIFVTMKVNVNNEDIFYITSVVRCVKVYAVNEDSKICSPTCYWWFNRDGWLLQRYLYDTYTKIMCEWILLIVSRFKLCSWSTKWMNSKYNRTEIVKASFDLIWKHNVTGPHCCHLET
jgi:hypothetical protein